MVLCCSDGAKSRIIAIAFLAVMEGCSVASARELVNMYCPYDDGLSPEIITQLDAFVWTPPEDEQWHRLRGSACELCIVKRTTPWFEANDSFTVLICDQCENPMAVWRRHTMLLSTEEKTAMRSALTKYGNQHLGEDQWYLDTWQRTIRDHVHWHARPHTAMSRMVLGMRKQKM